MAAAATGTVSNRDRRTGAAILSSTTTPIRSKVSLVVRRRPQTAGAKARARPTAAPKAGPGAAPAPKQKFDWGHRFDHIDEDNPFASAVRRPQSAHAHSREQQQPETKPHGGGAGKARFSGLSLQAARAPAHTVKLEATKTYQTAAGARGAQQAPRREPAQAEAGKQKVEGSRLRGWCWCEGEREGEGEGWCWSKQTPPAARRPPPYRAVGSPATARDAPAARARPAPQCFCPPPPRPRLCVFSGVTYD
jgi:hypothetical protein